MIDLRVHMVGAACQNDDPAPLLPGGGHDLRTLLPDLLHVTLIFSVGRLHRRLDLPMGDGAELPLHDLFQLLVVQPDVADDDFGSFFLFQTAF